VKPFSERLLDLLNDGDIERAMTHEDEDCIREAAALCKRYEDAPVGECVACDFEGYERPTWHVIDDREAVPLTLRGRVRILLDTERE
jgi:hypothetical protein